MLKRIFIHKSKGRVHFLSNVYSELCKEHFSPFLRNRDAKNKVSLDFLFSDSRGKPEPWTTKSLIFLNVNVKFEKYGDPLILI